MVGLGRGLRSVEVRGRIESSRKDGVFTDSGDGCGGVAISHVQCPDAGAYVESVQSAFCGKD